jgi:hypothetical protein
MSDPSTLMGIGSIKTPKVLNVIRELKENFKISADAA